MTDVILFGGTSEGRELTDFLAAANISAIVSVATDYGSSLLSPAASVRLRTGRLNAAAMEALFRREQPKAVVDATHPYAVEVSGAIRQAAAALAIPCLRLQRASSAHNGDDACAVFRKPEELLPWLAQKPGIIFSTLGAKESPLLAALPDFKVRIRLRILPLAESLQTALDAGFPAAHIICMQGPFSRELNEAMFRQTNAAILLTKDSGSPGGFAEKIAAAKACGMQTALLLRPTDTADACGSVAEMQTAILRLLRQADA